VTCVERGGRESGGVFRRRAAPGSNSRSIAASPALAYNSRWPPVWNMRGRRDRLPRSGTEARGHCLSLRGNAARYRGHAGAVVDLPHILADHLSAPIPGRGYGNSPIAYKNMIVVGVDRDRGDGEDAGGDAKNEEEKKAEEKKE